MVRSVFSGLSAFVCVCRTSADRRAATRWAWPTWGRCATPRGAAWSSRTTACRRPSPPRTSSVGLRPSAIRVQRVVPASACSISSAFSPPPRPPTPDPAGHVLSMPHDDSKTCERLFGDLGGHFLMAPLFVSLNKSAPWSPCSALYVTEFFDNGHGREGASGPPFVIGADPQVARALCCSSVLQRLRRWFIFVPRSLPRPRVTLCISSPDERG